jgi:hypothetical protein
MEALHSSVKPPRESENAGKRLRITPSSDVAVH